MNDVTVSVTFRHLAPTAAFKKHAVEKIHRIGKYFPYPGDAHRILAVDARQRQLAEVELHIRGAMFHGNEQHQNLYAAIDLALDKVERQPRKQKEKSKVSRRRTKA